MPVQNIFAQRAQQPISNIRRPVDLQGAPPTMPQPVGPAQPVGGMPFQPQPFQPRQPIQSQPGGYPQPIQPVGPAQPILGGLPFQNQQQQQPQNLQNIQNYLRMRAQMGGMLQ